MTRTRLRPALGRPAARFHSRVSRRPRLRLDLGSLLRPLGFLLVAGTAVIAAGLLLLIVLPFLMRSILSLLGIGTALLFPCAGILLWLGRRRNAEGPFKAYGRQVMGGLLLVFCGLGLASLVRPAGTPFLGISWAEASLGGLLGQLVLGEPGLGRFLKITALLLAGLAMALPQAYPMTARALLSSWLFVTSLRFPQRSSALARRALSAVRSALPPSQPQQALDSIPEAETRLESSAERHAPLQSQDKPGDVALTIPSLQSTLLPIIEGEEPQPPLSAPAWNRWELPALDSLEQAPEAEQVDQNQRAHQIEEALASYGVEAKVVQIHVGPAVTQFGVEPGWDRKHREVKERDSNGHIKLNKEGNPKVRLEEVSRTRVKVERIATLANNLALALAAPSVRIEAPVPGKQVVGIEVPNTTPGLVPLRSVIESPSFQRLRARSKLALALGKGVAGDGVVADLAKMPHLLIAGATGSGKSVCINSLVCCILMHATPEEVRFLMIDPKRVELVPYNPIPHLIIPVIVDPEKVVGTLQWILREMEERYRRFAAVGVRNIEGYNRSPKINEPLPFWVLIIDELADLMMVAPYEVERGICRLAQLARATGIHLIIATQRPSVDVVTGLIKANFPTRISFAVTSHIDSRTILDGSGAEKLLGRGDMLYMPTDAAKPKRVQGTFVSDDEVERIVAFWGNDRFRLLRPPQFAEALELAATSMGPQEEDLLLDRARELAETAERVSASFLQRRLRIGYPRAARLMEALQAEGYGEGGLSEGGF